MELVNDQDRDTLQQQHNLLAQACRALTAMGVAQELYHIHHTRR